MANIHVSHVGQADHDVDSGQGGDERRQRRQVALADDAVNDLPLEERRSQVEQGASEKKDNAHNQGSPMGDQKAEQPAQHVHVRVSLLITCGLYQKRASATRRGEPSCVQANADKNGADARRYVSLLAGTHAPWL